MQRFCFVLVLPILFCSATAHSQQISGISVTPHNQSTAMRWRRPPDPELAARVELFLRNDGDTSIVFERGQPVLFDGRSPQELLDAGQWAWHDTPASWLNEQTAVPPDSLTVLMFNGKSAKWGIGTRHTLQLGESEEQSFSIQAPNAWLSAVTFLATESTDQLTESIYPNRMVVHIRNDVPETLRIQSVSLWLPDQDGSLHAFRRSRNFTELDSFPDNSIIEGHGRGGFAIDTGRLPLTYAVLEVSVQIGAEQHSLWAHLRIRRETFDISGGWVASDVAGRNSLTLEPYLKTLKRMQINTGQIEEVGGYTDVAALYDRYPIKRFNRMQDLNRYGRDEMLPQIHAVEFLGEPQYGGGRPVAPQEVWEQLAPYQPGRLPTTVTLSEERTWRYYAGLSDYPHYDAYRVIAPAADSWRLYDRWEGRRIGWGAPLETIGDMTRSLRELSRPRAIAYWSQGAHDGWGGLFSSRRTSPTPDELRAQAWQGISNRITSLYWFNLSLKSLLKFPDLIDPITRVNREIRLLEDILLAGDAFEYRRLENEGQPDWDLNSISAPKSVLLVAHDLSYHADDSLRQFVFRPRMAKLRFTIPAWFDQPVHVFRVDAQGTSDTTFSADEKSITIEDQIQVVGIYVATIDPQLRTSVDARAFELTQGEKEYDFDPASSEDDLNTLRGLLEKTGTPASP